MIHLSWLFVKHTPDHHGTHTPVTIWSGKRDLNPRPPAWKAGALPLSYSRIIQQRPSPSCMLRTAADMFPTHGWGSSRCPKTLGRGGFEPPKPNGDRFTVCSRCPLGYLPAQKLPMTKTTDTMNIPNPLTDLVFLEPPEGIEPPTG